MTNWQAQIEQTTQDFQVAFGSLSPEALNWKPNANTWSIAQNIDHLIVINSSYFPMLQALHQGSYQPPWTGRIGFMVNYLGNVILKSVHPDRRKKIKTFPIWEPSTSEVAADILDRFATHQAALSTLIDQSQDLVAQGAVVSSPANKYIVYTLAKAFDIIVAHEQRHLAQAKEVYDSLPAEV